MSHLQSRRRQTAVRHPATNADQRHQPKLDLVPIGMAIDIDVIKCDRRVLILQAETQANAFIHDPAVALGVSQRLLKTLR